MCGALHNGFSWDICLINWRISVSILGRPGFLLPACQHQYRLNPSRCHLTAVAGCRMCRLEQKPVQIRERTIQNTRSWLCSFGRLTERRRTINCCRRAKFSAAKLARGIKHARAKPMSRRKVSVFMDSLSANGGHPMPTS